MRHPTTGRITGIRLRKPSGAKFSVRGGKEALFLPFLTPDDEVLLITEGATDAIAAHGVGFPLSVGRPSCTGGTAHLIAMVCARKPSHLVIACDNDAPGIRGGEALTRVLALHCRNVRVISPPKGFKDLRDWIAAGATKPDLEELIRAAEVRRVKLTISRGTK